MGKELPASRTGGKHADSLFNPEASNCVLKSQDTPLRHLRGTNVGGQFDNFIAGNLALHKLSFGEIILQL